MITIEGAENLVDDRIAYANANGLSHRVGATYREPTSPWRVVWHDTEFRPSSVENARVSAIKHRTPPHIWASFEFNWVGLTVPLDLAAYALYHDANDPETNHMHALQIEVFGFASEGFSAEKCDWLGRRVLKPILNAGFPIDIYNVTPTTGGDGYGEDGKVRLSWDWWRTFNGQCVHANVPGNVHWDVGIADLTRIARAAAPPAVVNGLTSLHVGGPKVMDMTNNPNNGWINLCIVGQPNEAGETAVYHYSAPSVEALHEAVPENLGGDVSSVTCGWAGSRFVVIGVGAKDGKMYTRYWENGQWTPTWFNTPANGLVGPDYPTP